MKILQVEDGLALVRHDEVQHRARRQRARFDGPAFLAHSIGEPPFPNRQRRGGAETERHFVQQAADALLLGRSDIGQRPPRFENLANRRGRPAFGGTGRRRALRFCHSLSLWTTTGRSKSVCIFKLRYHRLVAPAVSPPVSLCAFTTAPPGRDAFRCVSTGRNAPTGGTDRRRYQSISAAVAARLSCMECAR